MERRVHGKVTRDVLDDVFGPELLAALEAYGKRQAANSRDGLTQGNTESIGRADRDDEPDVLCGSDSVAGKLQVTPPGRTIERKWCGAGEPLEERG